MLTILQFQETEGANLRDMLRTDYGVHCLLVQAPFRVPSDEGYDVSCSIWRYEQPDGGGPAWIIELEFYLVPEVITRSWIIDQPPTWKEVNLIINSDAQEGSTIQSNEGI